MARFSGSVRVRSGKRRRIIHGLVLLALVTGIGVSTAQSPKAGGGPLPVPTMTIKQLMETTITDASNAIWNAYDPPASDEQWAALAASAEALIEATKVAAIGGTGPMDNEWVKQPAWKPFNDAMLQASEAALKAIQAKDHAALLAASDQLYPPCEGCHLQFNPGVVNQN